MNDSVSNVLVIGLIIVPTVLIIRYGVKALAAVYANQSLIMALPFP
jgi:hypothetical protein